MLKNHIKITLRNILRYKFVGGSMFTHFWITGMRNLYRDKLFTFINIVGLTAGITACILISFYVIDELNYDKFHNDYRNIYRVGFAYNLPDGEKSYWAVTPAPLAKALTDEFPQIKNATRIDKSSNIKVKVDNMYFVESNVLYADSNFFSFFNFSLVRGNGATSLSKPYSVVVTEETAIRYFSSTDVLGKTIFLRDDPTPYTITGVARQAPGNSHFHYDFIISLASDAESRETNWLGQSFYTYVRFNEGANMQKFKAKLPEIERRYIGAGFEQVFGYSMADLETKKGSWGHFLQPISDIHFRSKLNEEIEANGNITYLYILITTAIFIILVAAVNFINLSTLKSFKRAREVGVRKVFGVSKSNLALQFITEALIISTTSAVLSFLLASVLMNGFNSLFDKNLSAVDFITPAYISTLLLVTVLIGCLAGAYPALHISSYNPIQALQSQLKLPVRRVSLRTSLIVFQYVIAIGLLISTAFLHRQLQFLQQQDLGLDKNEVIIIKNASHLDKKLDAFKSNLKGISGISSVSTASDLPPSTFRNTLFRKGNSTEEYQFRWFEADGEYINALKLQMIKGRNFSDRFLSDSAAAIINEEAAKQLRIGQVGEEITFAGKTRYRIIGIVKNFQFESSHNKILPVVILPLTGNGSVIAAKVTANMNLQRMVNAVKAEWAKLAPEEPLDYAFLDESFDSLYKKEKNLAVVVTIFTGLITLIACLGLFSLAAFITNQRMKEVAVRKVIGASTGSLFMLLISHFVKLVVIALIISIPASYVVVSHWLQNFAYRITISWWIFALAGLLVIVIAVITISFQTVKAALANPVKSLRTE